MHIKFISYSILLAFVIVVTSCKKTYTGPYQGYVKKGDYLEVKKEDGKYIFKALSDKIIETSFIPNGEEFNAKSHAVVLESKNIETSFTNHNDVLLYKTNGIQVKINKDPFKITYLYDDKELISEKMGYVKTDTSEILDFVLDDTEIIYGGGARVVGMNRRGYRLKLYNKAHYGYETHSELMNFCIPMVLSSKMYAVHFDNAPIGYLDIDSKADGSLQYETIGGRKTYQVIAGENWEDVLDQYTDLTGKQPLPPRWAFGNFASRFGYHSEKETRATVEKFIKDSIPVDAVVIDIYWFGKDIKGHMGNLEFLRDSFPNPKEMIQDFQDMGVKTILVTEPFILTTSNRWNEAVEADILAKDSLGKPYIFDFYFGNSGIIDIYDPKAASWFWDIYKEYTGDYGVAGWWGDLGEPEAHPSGIIHATGSADEVHNIYGHDWARLIFEGYQKEFPDKRTFILMRAGYSGSQRFGLIPWSGDVSRSWGGLKPQTEISLQMGMQGMGYMHSDLGGFGGGAVFDPELYTRWLQFGVFQPIFRPHAQEHIAAEPVFHDEKTKSLAKKSIDLRYSLLPYNYSLAFENNQSGVPFMRPLFFENPTDQSLYELTNSYMWGANFLIYPVTEKGQKSIEIQFPSGFNWYDFYSGKKYEGGTGNTVNLSEEHIPVFVKGGSFIPMVEPVQTTDQYSTEALNIHYYFDNDNQNSVYSLYDDDGSTPKAFEKNEYQILKFESKYIGEKLVFDFTSETGENYSDMNRSLKLIIHNLQNKPELIGQGNSISWDEKNKTATVFFTWNSENSKSISLTL
jgi:alpha-glucosidase/oligosaccharide 4-alpha-D-glucosyltransferase